MTQEDADLQAAIALINRRARQSAVSTDATVAECAEHMFARHGFAKTTEKTYWHIWKCQIGPHFGNRIAMDLSDTDITDYRAKRRGEVNLWGAKKRLIRPATRNREVFLLMTILKWGTKHRLIPFCPITDAGKENEDNIRETVASEEQLQAVFDHPSVSQLTVAFALLLRDSGLRREEAVSVQWQDFRVDDPNPHKWAVYVSWRTAKGSYARYTILTRRTWDALRRLPRTSSYVFANPETSEHFRANYMYSLWRNACRMAGVSGPDGSITLHDLRRTFATKLGEAGVAERKIIKLLGHHTRATIDRYLIGNNSDFEGIAEVAERHTLQELTRLRVSKRAKSNLKLHP